MRALIALSVVGLLACPLPAGPPAYLRAEVSFAEGVVAGLLAQAQGLSLPTLGWTTAGPQLYGVQSEAELLAQETFLIWDFPYFYLASQTESGLAVLRGDEERGELIAMGTGGNLPPSQFVSDFIELLTELGLLPEVGCTIQFQEIEVPHKLPPSPEGSALDPVLWGLVNHPDWLGFARDYGLELTGLRVRVVVEKEGQLASQFEPYIFASTDGLAELILPIPLLVTLGQDPAVRLVRPPYVPHPAAPREGG